MYVHNTLVGLDNIRQYGRRQQCRTRGPAEHRQPNYHHELRFSHMSPDIVFQAVQFTILRQHIAVPKYTLKIPTGHLSRFFCVRVVLIKLDLEFAVQNMT